MKVLFVMFTFPNMEKSFNMYSSLAEEFHRNNHEVFVIAPSVNDSKTALQFEKGIPVLRVKTLPLKNVHHYFKGISNLLLPFQYQSAIKKHLKKTKFDYIISATPPITFGGLIAVLKKKNQAKFYLILRDIFPQNAVDLGFMKKNSPLHLYFRKKEKQLYRLADHIGCMSQGNIDYIIKHNTEIDRTKLHILENFQKLFNNYPENKIELRKRYGLEGKFVVIFGGNMGKPQKLENVLSLAKSCQKYDDVLFLLLGEGTQMNRIINKIKLLGITNIKIQPTIQKDEYQRLLSVCDIGLISLHEAFTIPNIPSKAVDYFNVGIPVLASLDSATDFGEILDITNTGFWCISGQQDEFFKLFEKLYHNPVLRKTMKANGNVYFKENLLVEKTYSTIENIIV